MFDISGYLDRNFDIVNENDTDYNVCCPFCIDDTKFHMAIAKDKQVGHCFRCGWGGSWISFVMQNSNVSYAFALGELYSRPRASREVTVELFTAKRKTLPSKILWLPEDFVGVCNREIDDTALGRKYLRKRGFRDEEVWKRYNLGVCPSSNPFRLIIPIENGYYQGRAMLNWMMPKYRNPMVEATDYIFNPMALELYDEVVILEGAFSAMAVGPNAVAIIGKEPVQEKVDRFIHSDVKRFCIGLDYGAEKYCVKLADMLSRAGKEVMLWDFKDDHDPADGGTHTEMKYDLRSKLYMKMKQVL